LPFAYDDLIEQLAGVQLGLVTRVQLRAHGMTAHAIASRVRAKRLRQVHRGVYRVGPVEAPHAREMAAVLACGSNAVISHRSAGWLWKLLQDPGDAAVDISLHQGDRGKRPGIRVHRVCLVAEDRTSLDNIPVTTVRRTLIDLSAVLDSRELERAFAQAERLNLLERDELRSMVSGHAGRPGRTASAQPARE
jgi:predicted transcriptional regulator of viral defense system